MVSFTNFHSLDPEARRLVLDLNATADSQPRLFTSFIYRWMAFNGWMSAITLEATDAAMVRTLAASSRLEGTYRQMLDNDRRFRQFVEDFSAFWPVLNVRDVRKKLGFDAFRQHDRAALLAACILANVKQEPKSWVPGAVPTWKQVLSTIYQVRCNLFHGEKSSENARDQSLVLAADRVLSQFIGATHCFEWHDQ